MKYFKRIAFTLALALCVSAFAACDEGGLESISKGLSTYTIEARYNDETHTLTGNMRIDYVNNYDTELDSLAFHLYGTAYREDARFKPVAARDEASAYPDGKSYGGMRVTSVKVGEIDKTPVIAGSDGDILSVALSDKLLPGGKVSVDIAFDVTLAKVRHRLGYTDKSVNLGGFYPIACVYENGAFRTDPYYSSGDPFYSEAANYTVTLTYPDKYKIGCSGNVTTETAAGISTSKSEAKAVRDFAAVLGEFEEKSATVGATNVKYLYYADVSPEASLSSAADALKTFNKLFGDYPYSSYTVVQTAFLQGGMEYPMLSMVSDKLAESVYTDAIIHETAHQWWYGVVGNDEVNDAWLDEALAEYSASLFYAKNESYGVDFEKRIADAMTAYLLYNEIYKPGMNADTSMNRSLAEYADAMEYTYMTYVKGQLMFDNLRRTIGDDAFYAALKLYYSDNYLKTATPDSLIACFEKTSKRELKSYFNSWIEGKILMYDK